MTNNFSIKQSTLLKGIMLSVIITITSSCVKEEEPSTVSTADVSIATLVSKVNSETYKAHNFNDGQLDPFTEDQGFTGADIYGEGMSFQKDFTGGKRLKLVWKESEYDGSRRERGHEIKLGVNNNDEIYTGFYLFIPSGQNNNLLNKNTIIWQLYNWNTAGCSNWTAHLELQGNALYLSYRNACVSPTVVKILDTIETDKELTFQIRAVLSGTNHGTLAVLMDGEIIADLKNINLGFGSFDANDNAETSVAGVKMGMYCFDTANYSPDETRILYLDNVSSSARSGSVANSLDKVDPRK
ncbi:hypothetical protein [Cellulophaga sp. L1A9]|uniref:hypothetical protein n=1 Tax=Cellulophaga sp. L1A9 TaxID=2686362 RepID=UPI00131D95EF|nr:hypothetical protein [Cellulophaga sp. L1A9]